VNQKWKEKGKGKEQLPTDTFDRLCSIFVSLKQSLKK
jgi:hypothetical protein